MLADHYNIVYRHSDRTPILLRISGNRLVVVLFFLQSASFAFVSLPLPEQTAADLIEAGIRQAWSGVYRLNLTGSEDEFRFCSGCHPSRPSSSGPHLFKTSADQAGVCNQSGLAPVSGVFLRPDSWNLWAPTGRRPIPGK